MKKFVVILCLITQFNYANAEIKISAEMHTLIRQELSSSLGLAIENSSIDLSLPENPMSLFASVAAPLGGQRVHELYVKTTNNLSLNCLITYNTSELIVNIYNCTIWRSNTLMGGALVD